MVMIYLKLGSKLVLGLELTLESLFLLVLGCFHICFDCLVQTQDRLLSSIHVISSGSLPQFSTIAFISSANRSRVHMNHTPFLGVLGYGLKNNFNVIQTNQTLMSVEPGCAQKVLV